MLKVYLVREASSVLHYRREGMAVCKKILVADDDVNIRELLCVNLRARGYEVYSAVNGVETVRKVKENRPDLIVLDIAMPEMDGWEVCKEIRDNPGYGKVKILFLTAKDSDIDKLIGKDVFRADEYITKPFDIDKLLGLISKILNE